mgnify:CR=1 FL=1
MHKYPNKKRLHLPTTSIIESNSPVVHDVQERGKGREARRGQGKQIQGQRGEENDGGNESVVILT